MARYPTPQLIGQRFGRLTVIENMGLTRSGTIWKCKCDCGEDVLKLTTQLRRKPPSSGIPRNPGCSLCETDRRSAVHLVHGGSAWGRKTPLFMVWKDMRNRCNNAGHPNWKNYGAKGITVCGEWNDFSVFRSWALANGYQKGLTIDRVRPWQNYEPGNCQWITRSENSRRIWPCRREAQLAEALLAA